MVSVCLEVDELAEKVNFVELTPAPLKVMVLVAEVPLIVPMATCWLKVLADTLKTTAPFTPLEFKAVTAAPHVV
jgi:hypothetical protein